MINYRQTILLATVTTLGFTGCSNPINTLTTPTFKQQSYAKPSAAKMKIFDKTMLKVALSTRDDAKYNKIKLDTPQKKAWFKDLMFRLWDRQITRHQFIAEGLSKYPTREYEFKFVSDGFQKHS